MGHMTPEQLRHRSEWYEEAARPLAELYDDAEKIDECDGYPTQNYVRYGDLAHDAAADTKAAAEALAQAEAEITRLRAALNDADHGPERR